MIRFWDSKLIGAPPLLSFIVRPKCSTTGGIMTIAKALLSTAIFASFTAALIADAPKNGARDDAKKLQGTWQVTTFIDSSEKPAAAEEIAHFTFEFKGDRLILRFDKDDPGREMKYTLDPEKKPKAIDIDQPGSRVSEGIYKLDGEVLTICVVAGDRGSKTAARPSDFKSSTRNIYSLFVLKKIKK